MARRVLALFFVAYSTWILLTWTKTAEQLLVGAVAAAAVGAACAPARPGGGAVGGAGADAVMGGAAPGGVVVGPDRTGRAGREPLHPGMVVAMVTLMAGCLVFGVAFGAVLAHVAAPAAGALLAGARYGDNVLAGGGVLPSAAVGFDYLSLSELATVAVTILVAIPLARAGPRLVDSRFVRRLRAVQSGSVNDYTAYLVAGLIVIVAALTLG